MSDFCSKKKKCFLKRERKREISPLFSLSVSDEKKSTDTEEQKSSSHERKKTRVRERKERKKRKKKTKKGSFLIKFFRKKNRGRKKKKNQMPLANKEVVHLKTGWEKIQVRVLLFTTLFFIPRSFVRLSLSLFFFLSFVCLCVYEEDATTTTTK